MLILPKRLEMTGETMQVERRITLRLWNEDDDLRDERPEIDDDMVDSQIEHVAGMIAQGFTSGELHGPNEESGWWSIETVEEAEQEGAA
jgi:hypothetical protein